MDINMFAGDAAAQNTTVGAVAALLTGRRAVVFAGAGISRDSGLPIASELTDEILQRLQMSAAAKFALADARLPFELFIETLAGCSDVAPLYQIYQAGVPGLFHHYCVELARKSVLSAVITTNFDQLFELAFEEAKVNFSRMWREAEFDSWSSSSTGVSLLKIHGSAHDEDSLQATIRRVANQRGVRSREKVLRTAFIETNADYIFVVGYSGSDKFDINPVLKRLASSSHPVVLVAHTVGAGSTATVESLATHSAAGPFAGFPGLRVACETGSLLRAMLEDKTCDLSAIRSSQEWQANVCEWINQSITLHDVAFSAYANGALLRAAARPRDSRQWFKDALQAEASLWLRTETFLALARCERDVGEDLDAARKAAKIALRLARRHSQPRLEVAARVELGVLAADSKQFERALRYYKSAENLALRVGEQEKVGICRGNAAIARRHMGGRRRWLRALRDYDAAIGIARNAGDKRSEGRTIGNLGVLHSVMGDSPLAITHFKSAAAIARELGDTYHEAIWLVGEADDTIALDRVRGIALVLLAKTIFSDQTPARIRECDEHLQRFGATTNEMELAMSYLHKANLLSLSK